MVRQTDEWFGTALKYSKSEHGVYSTFHDYPENHSFDAETKLFTFNFVIIACHSHQNIRPNLWTIPQDVSIECNTRFISTI